MRSIKIAAGVAVFIAFAPSLTAAQSASADSDPAIGALQDGNAYLREMTLKAAADMSAEDYTFKPTPEVRSFGQLLSHMADSNFFFCSTAAAEQPPVQGIEKTVTSRSEIQKILAQSFQYCDSVYTRIESGPTSTVSLMGKERSPFAVLMFRNYHGLLHYGNIITYMRIRGRVPPSSQPSAVNQ